MSMENPLEEVKERKTEATIVPMCEEIAQLLNEGEDYEKIVKLEHEVLMLRWVNYYLKEAK